VHDLVLHAGNLALSAGPAPEDLRRRHAGELEVDTELGRGDDPRPDCLAISSALPMSSPWPLDTKIASTFRMSSSFMSLGQSGFPLTHGLMRIVFPPGVTNLKCWFP
jgi:hypothetical protein